MSEQTMITLSVIISVLNFLVLGVHVFLVRRALGLTSDTREAVGRLEAPEPPNRFPVYLMGDEVTMLTAQELRTLAVDLVNSSGYEIILTDRRATEQDVADEVRWKAEVWNANRYTLMAFKSGIDGPDKAVETPGVLGVPIWVNNGPTPGSVMQLAGEWVARQSGPTVVDR